VMTFALAGEKAVAKQPAGAAHETTLPEGRGVLDQHLVHVIGMRQEKRVPGAQPEGGDVALLAGQTQEEVVGVAPEPGRVTEKRQCRGDAIDRHHAHTVRRRRAVHSRAPRCGSKAAFDRHGIRRPKDRSGWAKSWLRGVSCTNSPPGASTRAISTRASAAREMW
jgi:hypothetical protein